LYVSVAFFALLSSQMITSWTCWTSRPSMNRLVEGHRLYRWVCQVLGILGVSFTR
jgi:hypothetical protein